MSKRSARTTKPRAPRADTRERLLAAAETLFLEHGYEGTTLRMVAADAGVNLAAANYHFGGKDALFQAMLARRLDALHDARLVRLAEIEREARAAGAAPTCEQLLGAMFMPALAIARASDGGGRDFLRLLGRAYVDLAPALRTFLSERYAGTIVRFKDAFGRALPHLSKQELSWRLHFMLGALSYTLAGTDAWKLVAAISNQNPAPDEALLRRLGPFLAAGLKAPLPPLNDAADEIIVPIDRRAA